MGTSGAPANDIDTEVLVAKVRDKLSELCPGLRYGVKAYNDKTIFHLPAATGSDYRFFLEVGSAPMVKAYRNTSIVGKVTEFYVSGMNSHKDEVWDWPFCLDTRNDLDMERDAYVERVTTDFLEFLADIYEYETCIVIKDYEFSGWSRQCLALMKEGWIPLPRCSRIPKIRAQPIPHSDCACLYKSPPIGSR